MKGSRSVLSDSLQPHGLQPTRLLRPWDFPGKIFNQILHGNRVLHWEFLPALSSKLSVASLIAQLVKNLPAVQETPVQFLGQEDPLEKG